MKAILITAAVLMTGASVYGIVDYNKKSTTREFKNLYREEHPVVKTEAPVEAARLVPAKIEEVKAEAAVSEKPTAKKSIKKNRKFRLSEFSRAKLVPPKE